MEELNVICTNLFDFDTLSSIVNGHQWAGGWINYIGKCNK